MPCDIQNDPSVDFLTIFHAGVEIAAVKELMLCCADPFSPFQCLVYTLHVCVNEAVLALKSAEKPNSITSSWIGLQQLLRNTGISAT